MSDGLVAFITARLDEDEAAASAAAERGTPEWRRRGDVDTEEDGYPGENAIIDTGWSTVVYDEGTPSREEARHIARHDPARAMREVAAKRAILAQIAPWMDSAEDDHWYNRGVGEQPPYEGSVLLMKLLAAVWNDHSDYRAEWKP